MAGLFLPAAASVFIYLIICSKVTCRVLLWQNIFFLPGVILKRPEIPLNEGARLETLHALNLLDSDAEERFDRITRMAKHLFNVPIALVSLIDANRQWFKSCVGLSVRETPRDVSFCGHAILDSDTFIISDATLDARFADNPLVTGEPFVRFYAGRPLMVNNHRMGTLCIIDHIPREFGEEDRRVLEDLAGMVEHELTMIEMATHDELTGLSNRRGFMMLASYGLHFAEREGIPVSLAFIDLDDFKAINDNLGHDAGDHALISFSHLLQAAFRESDLIARLGGDEFAVLFPHADAMQAEAVMNKFEKSLQDFNSNNDRDYALQYTYGIVTFDADEHIGLQGLLKAGDQVMYAYKQARRATS